MVLRLGKFSDISEPGLHFKIPFGVDRVFKVAVQRQLKQEFGFRTTAVNVRSRVERVSQRSQTCLPATSTPRWWSGLSNTG